MKTVDILIRIDYDPEKFPEDDMRWAADKIAECGELYDIGHDLDSFVVTTSKVVHHGAS